MDPILPTLVLSLLSLSELSLLFRLLLKKTFRQNQSGLRLPKYLLIIIDVIRNLQNSIDYGNDQCQESNGTY